MYATMYMTLYITNVWQQQGVIADYNASLKLERAQMEVDKAHRDALLLRMVEGSKAGAAPLEELNALPEVVQTYVF